MGIDDSAREGGVRDLQIVRDEGRPLDDRLRAARRLATIFSLGDDVLIEARVATYPDELSRAIGAVALIHLERAGCANSVSIEDFSAPAREECERLLAMPSPSLLEQDPPPKRPNAKGVPLLERRTGVTLLVGLSGRQLLGRYEIDTRALHRVRTVCDRHGVAIDDVIERRSWFATSANGVICSIPRDLSHAGVELLRSWRAAPAEDADLLWVNHPDVADAAVAVDAAGSIHQWGPRLPPPPGRSELRLGGQGGHRVLQLQAGEVRKIDFDGTVLGSVRPSVSRSRAQSASVSPRGDLACVVQQLNDDETRPGWPKPAGVWLIDTDTLATRRVEGELDNWSSAPVWASDGQWIFIHCPNTPRAGLWAINTSERALRLVKRGLSAPWPLAALDD